MYDPNPLLLLLLMSMCLVPPVSPAAPTLSVIVMRHCVRSAPLSVYSGLPEFSSLDNYTSTPFPPFPVDDMMCLPNGITLVENVGSQLALPPGPVVVEVDTDAQRDVDTAAALMRGLSLDQDMISSPCLFDPESCGACEAVDPARKAAAVTERLEEFPKPAGFEELVEEMQAVMGTGAAPAMQDIDDFVCSDDGYWEGGTSVASDAVEYWLMQMGGGLEVAWGELSKEDVYRFLEAHVYWRSVQERTLDLSARSHSYMAREIVGTLAGGAGGARIMVGHDSDLDAVATIFGLEWRTPPFPANATTPGAGVRFDLFEDQVRAVVFYQALDGGAELLQADAKWTWGGEGGAAVGLEELQEWIKGRVTTECVL
ncbi:hypothetical protein TeGR_g1326 [Tetraparma gracilis]|uniref:Acid phosphatase n=1 Tax=Tetraparma gracilis TaxID=2962635 RepID=A0ABQ6MYC9_9STRA|nr:hypothetical protein TeGR_g1326 [Tetraparma gracilis]